MSHGTLRTLAVNFALMSLFAIGGGNSAVPEMQRLVVEVHHWMTDRQFTDLFALAQVTPGPNMIIVTLIGYQVAGVLGALVSTAAMCGPTCVLAFCIGGVWDRFKEAPWRLQSRLACYRFNRPHWSERVRHCYGGRQQYCVRGARPCGGVPVLCYAAQSRLDVWGGCSDRAHRAALTQTAALAFRRAPNCATEGLT
jgi:chromate transporter